MIDPAIRAATSLNITGSVVIFDEGHNIEDCAREAGSIDVSWQELKEAHEDTVRPCENDAGDHNNRHKFFQLQAALNKILAWLQTSCMSADVVPQVEPQRFQRVWEGTQVHTPVQLQVCDALQLLFVDKTTSDRVGLQVAA